MYSVCVYIMYIVFSRLHCWNWTGCIPMHCLLMKQLFVSSSGIIIPSKLMVHARGLPLPGYLLLLNKCLQLLHTRLLQQTYSSITSLWDQSTPNCLQVSFPAKIDSGSPAQLDHWSDSQHRLITDQTPSTGWSINQYFIDQKQNRNNS